MGRELARVVLASASPRRRALLEGAGVAFECRPAGVAESPAAGEGPAETAARLALAKAGAVAASLPRRPRRLVLGADTIVVIDGELLGKPRDAEHAEALLNRLQGREHRVLTGVAVVPTDGAEPLRALVESRVTLRAASADEVRAYVASGEPLDKAGAYALQGRGRRFVASVRGSETNVIGLPLEETLALLRRAGWAASP